MTSPPQQGKRIHHKLHHNVATIAELQHGVQRRVGRQQRAVEIGTARIGQPSTLYGLLAMVLLWTSYNLYAAHAGWRVPDPSPFPALQGAVALFAALVATMVLTTQNRQNIEAEQRAHLNLQINLIAEQKSAKIIALLEELRRDLPSVRNRVDAVAQAMQEEVDPSAVIEALENTKDPG
jgi:uncharacterized membrane protein